MYLEGDRVSAYFSDMFEAPDALTRTTRTRKTAASVVTARGLLFAMQRHLCPDMTPRQWLLYQYSQEGQDAFSALYDELKGQLPVDVTKELLPNNLIVVLDEAQLFATPKLFKNSRLVRACCVLLSPFHQISVGISVAG